jgi:hypothetical protein
MKTIIMKNNNWKLMTKMKTISMRPTEAIWMNFNEKITIMKIVRKICKETNSNGNENQTMKQQ